MHDERAHPPSANMHAGGVNTYVYVRSSLVAIRSLYLPIIATSDSSLSTVNINYSRVGTHHSFIGHYGSSRVRPGRVPRPDSTAAASVRSLRATVQ